MLALSSCAGAPKTSGDGAIRPPATGTAHARAPQPLRAFPKVTYVRGRTSLDQTVRYIGEAYGGGIVSILGIDVRAVPPMDRERIPFETFVDELAKSVDCVWLREPDYYLLLPQGYEVLLDTRIEDVLPARFEDARLAIAFGFNSKLFDVLASMAQSLGLPLVTDNLLGEQHVGELNVPETSLPSALEAVLRSARVAPGAFSVECTDAYLFVMAAGNRSRRSPLLNADRLPAGGQALLDRKVDIALPVVPPDADHINFNRTTLPLSQVLPALSAQLGVFVEASEETADLPVNPCIMPGIRLGTAMDLLIRQWPLPHYGYEVLEDRILIRTAP